MVLDANCCRSTFHTHHYLHKLKLTRHHSFCFRTKILILNPIFLTWGVQEQMVVLLGPRLPNPCRVLFWVSHWRNPGTQCCLRFECRLPSHPIAAPLLSSWRYLASARAGGSAIFDFMTPSFDPAQTSVLTACFSDTLVAFSGPSVQLYPNP